MRVRSALKPVHLAEYASLGCMQLMRTWNIIVKMLLGLDLF